MTNTVIHAGYGIAFDSIPTYSSAAAANTVPGLVYTCTATTYGVQSTAGCGTIPANTRLSQGFPAQLNVPTVQPTSFLSPPLQLLGSAPNIVLFDPNFKDRYGPPVESSPSSTNCPAALFSRPAMSAIEESVSTVKPIPTRSAPHPFSLHSPPCNPTLSHGCKPDGTGCPVGAASTPVPLVTSGTLTSAFVNSSTTITDLQQNAAGNFAGRIEQTTLARAPSPQPAIQLHHLPVE